MHRHVIPHLTRWAPLALWLTTAALQPACDGNRPSQTGDAVGTGGTAGGTGGVAGNCNSQLSAFVRTVWLPTMGTDCMACHVQHGFAAQSGSRFVLNDPTQPHYLANNILAVQNEAALTSASGESLLLAKATAAVPHGGGQRFAPGSAAYNAIQAYITTKTFETGCDQQLTQSMLSSTTQLSAADVLRKAALQVAGRLPTAAETQQASSGQLDAALTSVLASPSFGDYVLRVYDDVFLNISYNVNNVGIDMYSYNNNIAPNSGPNVPNGYQLYWYANNAPSGVAGVDDHGAVMYAMSTMGLQLIRYLATTGKDFRDVLNANYLMLNPWTARSFSTSFDYNLLKQTKWKNINDPNDYEPVVINNPLWPTVGLLSDGAFLNTVSTTGTNRNRKRARYVYLYWLGFDILSLSQRPNNLDQILAQAAQDPNAPPPFMSNTACLDCHSMVDRMASNFGGYNAGVDFYPPDGGFGAYTMFPAGFEGTNLPADANQNPLQWLAHQITADPRFARAVVTWWYTTLTGQQPLGDPPATTPDVDAALAAQSYQDAIFTRITNDFIASGYNVQTVIKELIESPYYSTTDIAANLPTATGLMLNSLVSYRWIGADAINNKLLATLGTTWTVSNAQWNYWGYLNQPMVREYEGLLGSIDPSNNITQAQLSPTGLMVRISTTMASQVACSSVAADFNQPTASRTLFPYVETTTTPANAAGVQAIQQNIAYLYQRATGVEAALVPENLADAYALFQSSLANGQSSGSDALNSQCQSGTITADPNHTVNAWIAVLTYILSDPRVVME